MPAPLSAPAARALLARAPVFHVAGTDADGRPLSRPLHGALVDDHLVFHGGARGEKLDLVGRPVVASHCEILARIPSTFLDPARACPATTLYRSVAVRGVIGELHDPGARARALDAFSRALQPTEGFAPITVDAPLYRGALDGLFIGALPLDHLETREKLGAERPTTWRRKVVAGLWARGAPGDLEALEALRAAAPDTPLPAPLVGPPGVHLRVAPAVDLLAPATTLLAGQYWNEGVPVAAIEAAHRGAAAWVVALDEAGGLLGTARAFTDGGKAAWIADVAVAPAARGQGIGTALMRLLLAHPALRVLRVFLGTRDAEGFYARLGFAPHARPGTTVLVRPGSA